MENHSGLRLEQTQAMKQEMRLNQFQQQSLYFLQTDIVHLLSEVEELKEQYPELQWKDGISKEWEQGNVVLNQRKQYPGEWRLEQQWQNGRFLSYEQLAESSDNKQQMLENYQDSDQSPELRTVLREQIYLWNLKTIEKEFCEFVLQNLDERGLNYENPILIASSFFTGSTAIPKSRLLTLLQKIQRLEPIGCACDSPLQSLIVQTQLYFPNSKLLSVLQSLPSLEMLGGLEDFLAYLKQQGFDKTEANEILYNLRKLEPYPARGYQVSNNSQSFRIYPEIQVHIEKNTGQMEIELLNSIGAKLEIREPKNRSTSAQSNHKDKEQAALLLQQLLRREETLLRIAQSIFEQQWQFVEGGIKYLRAMTLEMIAADLDLHISTISRCIQNKYCKTPWGTYPLRFFLSQGARNGQSREQIKERIVEIIQEYALNVSNKNLNTTKGKKLSDSELSRRFKKIGIDIARRTVTKYRAELLSEGRL